MAFGGRKPVNPRPHPEVIMVPVKIPVIHFTAIPKGPKNAKRLNETRINVGPPLFLKDAKSVKDFLKSAIVKEMKADLRKRGLRGINNFQGSVQVAVICPLCKEIGNPVIEWTKKYVNVDEINRRMLEESASIYDDRELALFFNHPKNFPHTRCRICKVVPIKGGFGFKPFKNSKIDLKDLYIGTLVRHILNKDKGYEKYSKIYNVQSH